MLERSGYGGPRGHRVGRGARSLAPESRSRYAPGHRPSTTVSCGSNHDRVDGRATNGYQDVTAEASQLPGAYDLTRRSRPVRRVTTRKVVPSPGHPRRIVRAADHTVVQPPERFVRVT